MLSASSSISFLPEKKLVSGKAQVQAQPGLTTTLYGLMQGVSEELRSHIFLDGQNNPSHHNDRACPGPCGPPPTSAITSWSAQPYKFWKPVCRSVFLLISYTFVQSLPPENFQQQHHPPGQVELDAFICPSVRLRIVLGH